MEIIHHLLIGFITSFLGTLFPSMLNMTSVKISIKETQKKAIYFSAGVSVIVIIQAYIAVSFSKILLDNPRYLIVLQHAGIIAFIGLSVFFFSNARKKKIVLMDVKRERAADKLQVSCCRCRRA